MSGKIIMSLAMSLDGYIATESGDFQWIKGDDSLKLDTAYTWDYNEFLKSVDCVLMGKSCYDQDQHKDFPQKQVFVATHQKLKDADNVHFIGGDLPNYIKENVLLKGKNLFLYGGGKIVDGFIKSDCIDQYIIGIIPIILGKGKPLFYENNPMVELKLDNYSLDKGITILEYSKR